MSQTPNSNTISQFFDYYRRFQAILKIHQFESFLTHQGLPLLSLVFNWNYFWFFVAFSWYRHISLNSRIIIWLIDIRNLPNECGWNKQIKSESFRFKHLTITNLPLFLKFLVLRLIISIIIPNVEPTKKFKPLKVK